MSSESRKHYVEMIVDMASADGIVSDELNLEVDHLRFAFETAMNRLSEEQQEEVFREFIEQFQIEFIPGVTDNPDDEFVEKCLDCGHVEESDGYGGNDCPACGRPMHVEHAE